MTPADVKLHVVTFYTEGHPKDRGSDLRNALARLRELVEPHVDSFTAFTPSTILGLPGAERLCKAYTGAPLPRNPKAELLGYYDFKPFVMLYMASRVSPGDLVLFHDCNFLKYPLYAEQDFSRWRDLCMSLLNDLGTDVFAPFESPGLKVKHHVKMHTMRTVLADTNPYKAYASAPMEVSCEEDERVTMCAERHLINTSRVLVRAGSAATNRFLSEWLDLAIQPGLVGPTPNDKPHPEFRWNCAEQDVLNVLVYNWIERGLLPRDFPRYYFNDRRFAKQHILKIQ